MWRVLTAPRLAVTLRELDSWSFLDLVHANDVLDAIEVAEAEARKRARDAQEGIQRPRQARR